MAPKKKGTSTIVEKVRSKSIGSESLTKSLGSTISLPNFVKDFIAICNEEQTTIVPEVVVVRQDSRDNKPEKKSSEVMPVVETSKESVEQNESAPIPEVEVKHNMYVMFENPDKYLFLRQIHFKDFRIEIALIRSLGRLIATNPTVSVLRLENCNLTSEGINVLAEVLAESRIINDLNLDMNPVLEQNYHALLEIPTMISHLSLRLCNIDDEGAGLLAHQLEWASPPTQVLVSLNLGNNRIGPLGAQHLGNALRTNRTLLSLSLASNRLKDEGAILLTTALGKFELTHEEIVMRRRRNLARIRMRNELIEEYIKAPKSSITTVSSKSTASRQASPLKTRRSGESSLKRVGSGKERKKLGSRESSATKMQSRTNTATKATPSTGSNAATSGDALSIKEKEKAALAAERRRSELIADQQMGEDQHPYSRDVWPEDKTLYSRGNQRLAHLNLAHNGIGSKGLAALVETMHYQEDTLLMTEETVRQGARGIIRLTLQGNPIPADRSDTLTELQELLTSRLERRFNASLNVSQQSLGRVAGTSATSKHSRGASKHGSARSLAAGVGGQVS